MSSMCRQTKGCNDRVEERIVGTKGVAWSTSSATRITGASPWTFEADEINPYVQEHIDLIALIRKGAPLNEGRQIAESTMCAIMGRMSAYTGRAFSSEWAMNTSKLDLSPKAYVLGPNPVDPLAVPATTPLVSPCQLGSDPGLTPAIRPAPLMHVWGLHVVDLALIAAYLVPRVRVPWQRSWDWKRLR